MRPELTSRHQTTERACNTEASVRLENDACSRLPGHRYRHVGQMLSGAHRRVTMSTSTLAAPRVAGRSAARSGAVRPCAALKNIGAPGGRLRAASQVGPTHSTRCSHRGEHAGAEAEGCAAPAATEGSCTKASVPYRGAAPAQQGGGRRPAQLGCV